MMSSTSGNQNNSQQLKHKIAKKKDQAQDRLHVGENCCACNQTKQLEVLS